jgi:hypothetical protein
MSDDAEPEHIGDNSRFGKFNSRFDFARFPVRLLREFARKGLI